MSIQKYEVDTTTQCGVMAHFTHYVPAWPWLLWYFLQYRLRDRDLVLNIYAYFEVYHNLYVCEVWGYKFHISWPHCYATAVAIATMLCPLVGEKFSSQPPKYKLDTTTQYWVIVHLMEYVTWSCDLDLWPFDFESCHVMPLMCSTAVPGLNWIWLTIPELRWLKFSIDR